MEDGAARAWAQLLKLPSLRVQRAMESRACQLADDVNVMPAGTLGRGRASGLGINICSKENWYCSTSKWHGCRHPRLYCFISYAAPLESHSCIA
jgi:hypothetical protein